MGILVISSPNLSSLEKECQKYFYSPNIRIDLDTLEIFNSKGKLRGHQIVKKRNRFRLEMI